MDGDPPAAATLVRTGSPGMAELENPEESPCFGCGPRHPRGLRLRFERRIAPDGVEEVVSEFTPRPDEVGWPTVFHHGLHFLVLNEVAYWAALTFTGRLWTIVGPATYAADRLPRVGRPYVARARLEGRTPDRLSIRATTAATDGRSCGTLEATWRPASRAVVERAGIPMPEYLREALGP